MIIANKMNTKLKITHFHFFNFGFKTETTEKRKIIKIKEEIFKQVV
jgi:hypothetical protein